MTNLTSALTRVETNIGSRISLRGLAVVTVLLYAPKIVLTIFALTVASFLSKSDWLNFVRVMESLCSEVFFVNAILLAPIIETFVQLLFLEVIFLFRTWPAVGVSAVTAVVAGFFHYFSSGVEASLIAAWAFFVLTYAFCSWRNASFGAVAVSLVVLHALFNSFTFLNACAVVRWSA